MSIKTSHLLRGIFLYFSRESHVHCYFKEWFSFILSRVGCSPSSHKLILEEAVWTGAFVPFRSFLKFLISIFNLFLLFSNNACSYLFFFIFRAIFIVILKRIYSPSLFLALVIITDLSTSRASSYTTSFFIFLLSCYLLQSLPVFCLPTVPIYCLLFPTTEYKHVPLCPSSYLTAATHVVN